MLLPESYCRISKAEEPFPETDPPDRQHYFHTGDTLYVKAPDGILPIAKNRAVKDPLPNLINYVDTISVVVYGIVTEECYLLLVDKLTTNNFYTFQKKFSPVLPDHRDVRFR